MHCITPKWISCFLCAVCVTSLSVSLFACTPSGIKADSESLLDSPPLQVTANQVLANPLAKEGQANPLEKKGQIAHIILRVKPADLAEPPLTTLELDAKGFLVVQENAPFTVLSDQGKNKFTGQVKGNTLTLPVSELGKAPYRIEVPLPGDALMVSELNDELFSEETRVLTAKQVRIVSNTQSCGSDCTQINGSGNTTVNAKDIEAVVNCVGITVNCNLPPQKTRSEKNEL